MTSFGRPLIFRFGAGLTPTGDVQLICATNTLDPVFWDASPRRLLASFVPGQWQLASPTARQRRRQRLSTASSPVKSTTFGPEGGGPEGGDKDGHEDGNEDGNEGGDKRGDSSDQDSGFRIQDPGSKIQRPEAQLPAAGDESSIPSPAQSSGAPSCSEIRIKPAVYQSSRQARLWCKAQARGGPCAYCNIACRWLEPQSVPRRTPVSISPSRDAVIRRTRAPLFVCAGRLEGAIARKEPVSVSGKHRPRRVSCGRPLTYIF
ncbi:hypothetical protein BDV09DRAFT_193194 [Aspergillus tetrazonus]